MTPHQLLRITCVAEAATGVVAIAMPGLVVHVLLGMQISGDAALLARAFGIALLSLAVAAWPTVEASPRCGGFIGMLLYNGAIAMYLGYVGAQGIAAGMLLWPAVLLHAAVAALQIYQWAGSR